jgi:hypothetical protein
MTRRFDFEEEDGLFVCCNDIGDDSDEVNKKHAGRFWLDESRCNPGRGIKSRVRIGGLRNGLLTSCHKYMRLEFFTARTRCSCDIVSPFTLD